MQISFEEWRIMNMEGYCQQCIHTDKEKPYKEFVNYRLMIHCNTKGVDVDCYSKQNCFVENKNWQHLSD